MKTIKKFTLIGVATVALMASSGCTDSGKKIKGLESQIETLQTQNQRLQDEKNSMQVTEEVIESSLRIIEGSTVPEFQTIEGKIKFPNSIKVPDSNGDVNKSNIMVGSMYRFAPSTNWQVRMNGANLSLAHPSKVWGEIKAITVKEYIPEDNMKSVVQPFFTNFPATNIKYRKIFMDDRAVGLLARADITVDKKPHVVNVGFLTRGEYGLIFLFDYEDNNTGVQQELVDVLISSGFVGDTPIRLE